ncbi:lipase family protein [Pseudanabaena sp. PCC 6802]|uniref:lipase family protein n=1 Tax=Pseudanabaena sp. PCC 6802 TaxID=118173 RepID=UPI000375BB5B|nr:lipase family protein [Pseudanabaena sp. PCC 6802]
MTSFSFKPNTTRYEPQNALWLGQSARLVYSDSKTIQAETATWGFSKFRFFDKEGTQAFAIANDELAIVALRGSEEVIDWVTNAKFNLVDGMGGKVHQGFNQALTLVYADIRQTITEFQDKGQSLWFTGHSLGGALATLAVAKLRYEEDKPVYGLYTYGQPRSGDRNFERIFNADFKSRTFRFVNHNDIVSRIPPRSLSYSHVGTFLYFDEQGNIHSDAAWWYRFLDLVKVDINDLQKTVNDPIEDHEMDRYLKNLQKNINVYPRI